jgi:hypothetical protein
MPQIAERPRHRRLYDIAQTLRAIAHAITTLDARGNRLHLADDADPAILSGMKPTGAVAFSIKVDPVRFPADLWPNFQQAARARGEVPIDALRRLLENYIKQPSTGATP